MKRMLTIAGSLIGLLALIGVAVALALTLSRQTTSPEQTATLAAWKPTTATLEGKTVIPPSATPTKVQKAPSPTITATPGTVFDSPLKTPMPPPTPDPDGWLAEKLRVVSDEPFKIQAFSLETNDEVERPIWSPNSENIVVDRFLGAKQVSPTLMIPIRELWVLDLNGAGVLLAEEALAASWSPDGKHVAYLHRVQPYQYELWFTTWPGLEKQWVVDRVGLGEPFWLANDKVVFGSLEGDIQAINPVTRQVVRAIQERAWTAYQEQGISFSSSPDGSWLVVRSEQQAHKLVLVSLESGKRWLIPSSPNKSYLFIIGSMAWSPDSQRFAHIGVSGGRDFIHVVDVRLGQEWDVFVDRVMGDAPHSLSWSPDGNMLIVVLRNSHTRKTNLYVVNADGTNWRNLSRDEDLYVRTPAWSPDGKHIFYSEYSDQDHTTRPRLMTVAPR